MAQEKHLILVTWDFTERSEFALEHAIAIAKKLREKIGLLHIVKKENEVQATRERIKGVIAEKYQHLDEQPEVLVEAGNIFTTISKVAEDCEARMVIMGTHGIKGMQKFFGSWALKVIAHTKVPFIVVQEPPRSDIYKNIALPLNFRKENKECINWASYFSKHFGSNFHILTAKHNDPNFLKGIESNISFINKYFKAKGISYSMEETAGETDFVKEALEYANEKRVDAIFIVTTKDIGLADYMLGAHEQYLIANEYKIPVICINPKPPKIGGSFSTSGS